MVEKERDGHTRGEFGHDLDARRTDPNDGDLFVSEIVARVPVCRMQKLSLERRQAFDIGIFPCTKTSHISV